MNYYYLYNPSHGWKLIATGATASGTKTDRFVGEVDAKTIDRDVNTEDYIMQAGSGMTLREYAAAYVSVMERNPNYHILSEFGKLKLKTFSGTNVEYEPKFADVPAGLLQLENGSTY